MKQIKLNNKFLLVDGHVAKGNIKHQDEIYYYFCTLRQYGDRVLSPFFEDLAKIKGVYLYENPHPRRYIMATTDKGIVDTTEKLYLEAEEKTYRNPFIFKLDD